MIQRRISGYDHDDRPIPRSASPFPSPQLGTYPHTRNRQIATEICLDEHADGPAAELRGKSAARRPDPAFPSERDGSPPRTDRPLGDRTFRRTPNRTQHVGFRDGPRTDVVQEAVIRFTDDGIGRAHVFVTREREEPGEHRVRGAWDAERAGEHNRRLQLAELIHLGRAGDLSESVADYDRRRNLFPKWIAADRKSTRLNSSHT